MWLQMFILSSEDFFRSSLSLNSDTPSPSVVADWETRTAWPLLIIEMVDFKNSSHE
ncbi:hypothetical protein GHT06_017774 [Daphnia sinensis]|uniref:Uncharacterized protein n=1 Tax=Daphnia sinensis TaxID=1820382 RepID=A0AAD5KLL9_9CRUS|nr:hypothetical protein GHT06_017774 [Daphnia sinensis]